MLLLLFVLVSLMQSLMMMMMMMMMIMMTMNSFYGMVDQQKAFSLISSQDHCQRSSPLWISDTPRAGFEPSWNLSSGLVEWSCAVLITTIPRCRFKASLKHFKTSFQVFVEKSISFLPGLFAYFLTSPS